MNEPKKALTTFRFWQRFLFFYICKSNFSKMSLIGLQGAGRKGFGEKEDPQKKRKMLIVPESTENRN